MSGPIRFLVSAYTIPVQASGTPIIIRRLLHNFTTEEVILIGRTPTNINRLAISELHYPFLRIPSLAIGVKGERYWMALATLPGVLTGLRAIQHFQPKAILAIYPDEGSLLIGYLLHRLTGLPLIAYFCDLYMETRQAGWQARLAKWLQPRIFKSASRIIAINKGVAQYFTEQYLIQPVILPTCINHSIPDFQPLPSASSPFVIGYSGSVNDDRLDPLQQLVKLIDGRKEYELHYFTSHSKRYLQEHGVWGTNTRVTFVADETELINRLSQCNLLYLPLTFKEDRIDRSQLATCFGIKSYEYLISRCPVLVHCPPNYFTARFYHESHCGLIVPELNTSMLESALTKLKNDQTLRESLVQNAVTIAHQFEGKLIANHLRNVLEEVSK